MSPQSAPSDVVAAVGLKPGTLHSTLRCLRNPLAMVKAGEYEPAVCAL